MRCVHNYGTKTRPSKTELGSKYYIEGWGNNQSSKYDRDDDDLL